MYEFLLLSCYILYCSRMNFDNDFGKRKDTLYTYDFSLTNIDRIQHIKKFIFLIEVCENNVITLHRHENQSCCPK